MLFSVLGFLFLLIVSFYPSSVFLMLLLISIFISRSFWYSLESRDWSLVSCRPSLCLVHSIVYWTEILKNDIIKYINFFLMAYYFFLVLHTKSIYSRRSQAILL